MATGLIAAEQRHDSISEYWRLCRELSVVQAALLIVGLDPSGDDCYVQSWETHERPKGYEPVRTAVSAALRREEIKGRLVPQDRTIDDGLVDAAASTVEVASLCTWLSANGVRTGFFFPTATDAADYLDPRNARYAPKLAAAIHAWQAVTHLDGKHPKQALLKWLRENASKFDLTDEDGKLNEQGIEEVAKVANWQPAGGAPRTPGGNSTTP